jgi:hypothetical protein
VSENNIYIVDANAIGIKDKIAAGFRVFVSAKSKSAAAAFVARKFVSARQAKPAELLGVGENEVIDADTGLSLAVANTSIQDAAQQLAADTDNAVGGTD